MLRPRALGPNQGKTDIRSAGIAKKNGKRKFHAAELSKSENERTWHSPAKTRTPQLASSGQCAWCEDDRRGAIMLALPRHRSQ